MKQNEINWKDIPEIITKEQLYKICHISKRTALYLLESGKIPCQNSGRKTRCYNIKKSDVVKYLRQRETDPEKYSVPKGWYGKNYHPVLIEKVPKSSSKDMCAFFKEQLSELKDVITVKEIVDLTGYSKSSIYCWCRMQKLRWFQKNGMNYIPKVYLIEFFCSPFFQGIRHKSEWHRQMLQTFLEWENK